MERLATQIWEWCIERDIYLSVSHICSEMNVDADFLFRFFSDLAEWMLKKFFSGYVTSALYQILTYLLKD